MVNIKSVIKNNTVPGPKTGTGSSIFIIKVDGDPSVGGCDCISGTIAVYNNGSSSSLFIKTGDSNTDWVSIPKLTDIITGLENWTENNDGDLLPNADITQSLGTSSYRISNVYLKNATMGDVAGAINTGDGSIVAGKITTGGQITSTQPGSVSLGYAAYTGTINATSQGSIAIGSASNGGSITSSGNGSISFGGALVGNITTSGLGSMAGGVAFYGGNISSNGAGSIALGSTYIGGYITSGASGSIAMGSVAAGYSISAINYTSMAFGVAQTGNIIANAESAVQIGIGSNSEGTSLQVGASGSGVHIHGAGLPDTISNGDIWVSGGYTYIRSNGVSVKIV